MNDIIVLFYFYFRGNKNKIHASCLFINITADRVPWQRNFCETLSESRLLLYRRFFATSRVAKKSSRHTSDHELSTEVLIVRDKCIGDDTKAAARQSPICIKYGEKRIFNMAD